MLFVNRFKLVKIKIKFIKPFAKRTVLNKPFKFFKIKLFLLNHFFLNSCTFDNKKSVKIIIKHTV